MPASSLPPRVESSEVRITKRKAPGIAGLVSIPVSLVEFQDARRQTFSTSAGHLVSLVRSQLMTRCITRVQHILSKKKRNRENHSSHFVTFPYLEGRLF